MHDFKYLIVGGGMTADSAVDGIRQVDKNGSIGMITQEQDEPYDRPPLTKGLWTGKKSLENIWRKTRDKNVEIYFGRTVQKISPRQKSLIADKGEIFHYEKLLIATGGSPRKLDFGGDEIIYFRTLPEYKKLREMSKKSERFAVIGAGFIGSEIAAALAMNGKKVVLIFPGQRIGEKIFPAGLSQFVTDYYKSKNVELIAGGKVASLEKRGKQIFLKTNTNEIATDGVIAGIGIEPNIELAQQVNLKIENGIVVDEFLRTTECDIYAAGDVAAFYNRSLEKRIRVEHEDNANMMGKLAGRNMAGNSESYDYLPYFYSDMFELGYEAIGEMNSSLEIFEDWKKENEKGVIYYLANGRVRGVLLWNVWKQVEAARKLISEKGPFEAKDLKGRLG